MGVLGPVLGPDYSISILLVERLMDGAMPGCLQLCLGIADVRDVAELQIRDVKKILFRPRFGVKSKE